MLTLPRCLLTLPRCVFTYPRCVLTLPRYVLTLPRCMLTLPRCVLTLPGCMLSPYQARLLPVRVVGRHRQAVEPGRAGLAAHLRRAHVLHLHRGVEPRARWWVPYPTQVYVNPTSRRARCAPSPSTRTASTPWRGTPRTLVGSPALARRERGAAALGRHACDLG
jgi:hypothetical protein